MKAWFAKWGMALGFWALFLGYSAVVCLYIAPRDTEAVVFASIPAILLAVLAVGQTISQFTEGEENDKVV